MSDNPEKIVITPESLESSDNQQRVQQMQDAQKVPLVRPIGAPTDMHKSASGGTAILLATTAGLGGGVIAFCLQKLFLPLVPQTNSTASNLLFSFILAFAVGLTVSLADAASSRVAAKIGIAAAIAIPAAIVLGLSIGALANGYYSHSVTSIFIKAQGLYSSGSSDAEVSKWIQNQLHFPRGIAWMIIGIAAGLTVGIASRSIKRGLLTTGGGAIGGFTGGAVFDFFSGSDWLPQLVGIGITGLLIGLSMGLLEQAARTQWIEIVAGGMAGKQFILYKANLTIGSAPNADITLIKDSAIASIHARIFAAGGRTFIESTDSNRPVIVDGFAAAKTLISDGSNITIGGTQIRFRERKGQPQVSGSIGTLS
jgi:Inner membrane component of T3SS, cytoplasmic domain